jgi:hypothetical protein
MNIDRITNLIRVLKTTPIEKFNINMLWDRERVCGCAIGHAMMDEYFYNSGFRRAALSESIVVAASKFFELTVPQANDIFFGTGYPTQVSVAPQDVVDKLEMLLSDEEIYDLYSGNEMVHELELEDA